MVAVAALVGVVTVGRSGAVVGEMVGVEVVPEVRAPLGRVMPANPGDDGI